MSNRIGPDSSPEVTRNVRDAIKVASNRTGVNFDYLVKQAAIESGFNPRAKAATSSAAGLFQFTKQTWLSMVKRTGAEHGLAWAADAIRQNAKGHFFIADPAMRSAVFDLRNDPVAASNMAAELAQENEDYLSIATGRDPEQVDLYLAHFLGANNAARFLKRHAENPAASAAAMFPEAAAANRSIFYFANGTAKSLQEIRTRFAAKLESQPTLQPEQYASGYGFSGPRSFHMPRRTNFQPSGLQPEYQRPLELAEMRPMPGKLSLDFAAQTYRRLAAIGA